MSNLLQKASCLIKICFVIIGLLLTCGRVFGDYVSALEFVDSVPLSNYKGHGTLATGEPFVVFQDSSKKIFVTDVDGQSVGNFPSVIADVRSRVIAVGGAYIAFQLNDDVRIENISGQSTTLDSSQLGNRVSSFRVWTLDRTGAALGSVKVDGIQRVWVYWPKSGVLKLMPKPTDGGKLDITSTAYAQAPYCLDTEARIVVVQVSVRNSGRLVLWDKIDNRKPNYHVINRDNRYTLETVCGRSVFGDYSIGEWYNIRTALDEFQGAGFFYRDSKTIRFTVQSPENRIDGDARYTPFSSDQRILAITPSGFLHADFDDCSFITKKHYSNSRSSRLLKFNLPNEQLCETAFEHAGLLFIVSPAKLTRYKMKQASVAELAVTLSSCRPCVNRTAEAANRSKQVVRVLDKYGEAETSVALKYLGDQLIDSIGWKRTKLLLDEARPILVSLAESQSKALLWNLHKIKRKRPDTSTKKPIFTISIRT